MSEKGFPNVEMLGWNGYFAPARTPEPVLARLHAEIAAAAQHPPVAARIRALGAESGGNPAAEFAAAVHARRSDTPRIAAAATVARCAACSRRIRASGPVLTSSPS
jgi:tripartite-type tricarboxylate transporter receptor subunit TctC